MWNYQVELEKKKPICRAGNDNVRHLSVKLSNVITAWAWRKQTETHPSWNSSVLDCWQACYWIIPSFLLFSQKMSYVLAWISSLLFIHSDSDFMLVHMCHFTFNWASVKRKWLEGGSSCIQATKAHALSTTEMVIQVPNVTILYFCWFSLFDCIICPPLACVCLHLFGPPLLLQTDSPHPCEPAFLSLFPCINTIFLFLAAPNLCLNLPFGICLPSDLWI